MIYRKKLPEGNRLFVVFLYPFSQGLHKRPGSLHHPLTHINGYIDGGFAGHAYNKGIWHTECRQLTRRRYGTRTGFFPGLNGERNWLFIICRFSVIVRHE